MRLLVNTLYLSRIIGCVSLSPHALYTFLYSPEGFAHVKKWFATNLGIFYFFAFFAIKICLGTRVDLDDELELDAVVEDIAAEDEQGQIIGVSEWDFCIIMKRLTNLQEYAIFDAFDLLDKHYCGSIFFDEFYLLLALLAAHAASSTKKFLFLHFSEVLSLFIVSCMILLLLFSCPSSNANRVFHGFYTLYKPPWFSST
jgi:hypothetical protein